MSGQPAARIGDKIVCTVPQATPAALPHAPPPGLPIVRNGCLTVLIGNQPAARIGDESICLAPAPTPNPIIRGAFPVRIGGSPAARLTDSAAHPGSMIAPPCCESVLIGLAGVSGDPWAARARCEANAQSRTSGTQNQGYGNNCGVESSRTLINQAGGNISEDALLQQAINSGLAHPGSGLPNAAGISPNAGLTSFTDRQTLLANNGVPSTTMPQNLGNISLATGQGQGVIASVDAGLWYGNPSQVGSGHAINVTGVEYDDAGNPTKVYVNDSGDGTCMKEVTPAHLSSALRPSGQLNVTTIPRF